MGLVFMEDLSQFKAIKIMARENVYQKKVRSDTL